MARSDQAYSFLKERGGINLRINDVTIQNYDVRFVNKGVAMSVIEMIKHILKQEISEFKTICKDLKCVIRPMKLAETKENFSSNLYTADLINQSTNKTISVIVKIMPDNPRVRRYHSSDNQFHNEDVMYQQVIPLLIKSSRLTDETLVSSLFPKSYYGNHDGESSMIVLEDLKTLGFTLAGSNQILDFEHCQVALNGLARFHALSYAMKRRRRDAFMDVVRSLREARFNDLYRKRSNVYLKYTSLETVNYINRSEDKEMIEFRTGKKEFLERLQQVFESPVAVLESLVVPEEPLGVLCHGDFYRNNMMFHYEHDKPNDVKFLDFQTVRYANPSTDIVFFLHMNTTKDLRKQHLRELLASYHKTLLNCLVQMSDCSRNEWENQLNLKMLQKDVERHALYGYIISTMFLHLLLATRHELQGMEELKRNEKDEVIPSQEYLKRVVRLGGDEAIHRSVAIIQEMAEMDHEAVFYAKTKLNN